MNKKRTTSGATRKTDKTDWDALRQMTDEDIDCSDIAATDSKFWASAKLVMPEPKVSLGVRFDRDLVDWFKAQGPGYQTRMNAVLRAYMNSQAKGKRKATG